MPDLTASELARRHGVARSTMTRALSGGRTGTPAPGTPKPVNPGEPQLRYRTEDVDPWWPKRRTVGRPATTPAADPPREEAR